VSSGASFPFVQVAEPCRALFSTGPKDLNLDPSIFCAVIYWQLRMLSYTFRCQIRPNKSNIVRDFGNPQ
jgi:hypothetical protein